MPQRKKKNGGELPKYIYPLELVTAAAIYPYARNGIEFVIPRAESVRISTLDAQRPIGKSVFGGGLLISKRLTAEREKIEREKVEHENAEGGKIERFQLSERELAMIDKLS